MVSFKRLGDYGRLGNQLFQYAFLRSTARRLKTQFYCPEWVGDHVFKLDDGDERARKPHGIHTIFKAPENNSGFDRNLLALEDGADIVGYFQSERFFYDKTEVRSWYTFKNEKIQAVKEKYRDFDFSRCVGMHLRFGDKKRNPLYYLPSAEYYRRALQLAKRGKQVLVFSDEIPLAKDYLKGFKENLFFIDDNDPYEDLFLMSACRDFVCSISTLSWWGAWLNPRADKTILVPREGHFRPGGPFKNPDYWCEGWLQIRALRKILDSYPLARLKRGWKSRP